MFTKEVVLDIAAKTGMEGRDKVLRLINEPESPAGINVEVVNTAICSGEVNGHSTSVSASLDMHCTCKAWEMSASRTCKHGCAMALAWLDRSPNVLLPLKELIKDMDPEDLFEKVFAHASTSLEFERILRE